MPMLTFIVRLWSSDEDLASDDLHGVLESAAPRKLQPFRDDTELVSLLKAGLRRENAQDVSSDLASRTQRSSA
jgi:hypothetical protein